MNDTIETDEEREAREREAEARLRARRCRIALGQAPELAQHIRSMLTPPDGRTERGVEIVQESTPLLTGIADDADELYTRILDWVAYWHRWLEFMPATVAKAWRPREDVAGFPAGTSPAAAAMLVRVQTAWLVARAPYIDRHPAAGVYQDDVVAMIWGFRAKYRLTPHKERPVLARACPACGENGIEASWRSEDLTDVLIECVFCRHQVDAPRASQILRWLS